jgi:hypothetical protein
MLLITAVVVGLLLSDVHVWPAFKASMSSRRAAFTAPRSVYEVPTYLNREGATASGVARGLFGPPEAQEHHRHIYDFSVGPWRWAELIWPNFGGKQFPINSRWMSAIPAEGRVWTPTLYMGLAPLLAGLAAMRFRKGPVRWRWLSWTALLSLLAALGWYGGGFAIRELQLAFGKETGPIGAPVGGLYWLLVVALPGYASFRFPAKLMVLAALALSLLAGRSWQWFFAGPRASAKWSPLAVIAISVMAMALLMVSQPALRQWLESAPGDDLFGPLDVPRAISGIWLSLAHALLAAIAIALLQRVRALRRMAPLGGLLLLVIDLIVAQNWLAPTAPVRLWHASSPLERVMHEGEASQSSPRRAYRGSAAGWTLDVYRKTSSPDRQLDALRWDRLTLYPRHHLLAGVEMVESRGSAGDSLYFELFRVASQRGPRRSDGLREPHRAWLDLLGAEYLILPSDFAYEGTEKLVSGPGSALYHNPHALPRAWIVHRAETAPAPRRDDLLAQRRFARSVLFPQGKLRDFRQSAVIEGPAEIVSAKTPYYDGSNSETARIVRYDARTIELEATLERAGWLILADRYDAAWRAESRTSASGAATRRTVRRANGVLRAIELPKGKHRVTFYYRPTETYIAGAVSLLAWLMMTAYWVRIWRRIP